MSEAIHGRALAMYSSTTSGPVSFFEDRIPVRSRQHRRRIGGGTEDRDRVADAEALDHGPAPRLVGLVDPRGAHDAHAEAVADLGRQLAHGSQQRRMVLRVPQVGQRDQHELVGSGAELGAQGGRAHAQEPLEVDAAAAEEGRAWGTSATWVAQVHRRASTPT
ncbi:MAG: hypothetical protein R2702_11410 [Acidimicrobiales bacterium]